MSFKKILGISLCFAVVCFGFAGCKKSDDKSSQNTAEQNTQRTTETTQAKISYEKGKIEGSEYVNESMGIKFTLPQGHKFMTEEEFLKNMGIGADALMNDDSAQALKDAATSRINYEMATNSSTGANVNVIVENLGMDIDEKSYADIAKKQLEAANVNVTYKGDGNTNLAGIEFYESSHEIDLNGFKQQQKQLIKSLDKKIMVITFTYTSEDGLKAMEDGFSEYKKQ